MKKTLFFLLVSLLFSCSLDTSKSSIQQSSRLMLTDSLSFKTRMAVRHQHSGTYFNEKTKEELFYFSNIASTKTIKFFNKDSILVDTVQLNSVLMQSNIHTIDAIDIISLDTILILSQNSNTLFFIDRQGAVFKELSLDELFQKNSDDIYSFRAPVSGTILLNDSTVVLQANWDRNKSENTSELSRLEYLKHYVKSYWTKPSLLVINQIFDENPNFIFKYSIFPQVIDEIDSTAFLGEFSRYDFGNNQIISWTSYSDKIVLLDSASNVLSVNPIKSSKSEIGDQYFNINKENVDNFEEVLREHERTSSRIGNVIYDSNRNIYYIKVSDKRTLEWFNKNKYRQWSLLVYDEEFNKLEEISFDKKKYGNGMFKLSKLGLMIEVKKEITDYKNQTLDFEIYNYEK